MEIAIIGGGAAGLMAAVTAKRLGASVIVFEQNDRVGKKLLATGNGRCNLSNSDMSMYHFHGAPSFAQFALTRFGTEKTESFFESIGVVLTTDDTGRMYPYSLQASSVLDMFRHFVKDSERVNEKVVRIIPQNFGFNIKTTQGTYYADKVIAACGGKAAPKLSGGGSYELLTALGHTVTKLTPAIVQVKASGTRAMEGIKVNAVAKTNERTEAGEVLFTSYGLSGPPILQLARDIIGKDISLDLAPDFTIEQIKEFLKNKALICDLTVENLFTGFLNKKVGRELLRACNILPFSKKANTLTEDEISALCYITKNFVFTPIATTGFENAQVTSGGIRTEEFDEKTMQSRLVPGLFAAGEMLDVDGDCGGYNLQWAWASGNLAAHSAVSGGKA